MNVIEEGDKLIITKLETLSENAIIVEVLNLFEHDMIIQRTQEGKAIVRQNANFKDGRPKKFSRVQLDHALELLETYSYTQVERITGISITTIYRAYLAKAKTENQQY